MVAINCLLLLKRSKKLSNRKAIFLFGPTASGKTSLAIFLAQKLNGVIINADSRQVYKGMPIITAMPTADEFAAADHRLFNFLNLNEKITVEKYVNLVKAEMLDIWSQGQLPILCGGTGFYMKVLEEGIAPLPALNEDVLNTLNKQSLEMGTPCLHQQLATVDPVMAAKLKENDTQRVVRALGVYQQTQKTMSEWQKMPKQGGLDAQILRLALNPDRAWLYNRIHKRYDVMVEMGLMDEIKLLINKDVNTCAHALQSCGAKDLLAYQKGEITEAQAKESILQSTRNYAKRQFTWLKGQYNADLIFESVADAQNQLGQICNFVNKS